MNIKTECQKRFLSSWKPLCLFCQYQHTCTDCHKRKNLSVSSQEDHSVTFLLTASCGMSNPPPGSLLSRELVVCKQPQVISDQWMILTREINAIRQRPSWQGCLALIPHRFKWTPPSSIRESNMENQCNYVNTTNQSSVEQLW